MDVKFAGIVIESVLTPVPANVILPPPETVTGVVVAEVTVVEPVQPVVAKVLSELVLILPATSVDNIR